jgi:hypothetical protein
VAFYTYSSTTHWWQLGVHDWNGETCTQIFYERKEDARRNIDRFGEVERIVNSRPLTHVSDDNHDPLSLTPNHFLIGVLEVNVSPGVFGTMNVIGDGDGGSRNF